MTPKQMREAAAKVCEDMAAMMKPDSYAYLDCMELARNIRAIEITKEAPTWDDVGRARQEGARLAIAAAKEAEPVAEFKADENGHITLRALDAWQGETGNLYAHPPAQECDVDAIRWRKFLRHAQREWSNHLGLITFYLPRLGGGVMATFEETVDAMPPPPEGAGHD